MRGSRRFIVACLALAACVAPLEAQRTTTTGTLATTGDAVTVALVGVPSETLQLTGTWAGTALFEVSIDGTTWQPALLANLMGGATAPGATSNAIFVVQNVGYAAVRVRAFQWSSGTATVTATRGLQSAPPTCNALTRAAGVCK